jgi:hypothetical protein
MDEGTLMSCGIALLLCLLALSPASAGIVRVPGDHPGVQAAIDSASAGDTILVRAGTYAENLVIRDKGPLTLLAEAGAEATILDGSAKAPVVQIEDCRKGLTVLGFTLRNGYAEANGGGLVARRSQVVLKNCRFIGNRADNSGGALSVLESPNYTVESCLFESNVCNDEASTASFVGGRGEFTGNTVRKNTGALSLVFMQAGCVVRDNLIVDNLCTGFGALAYQIALSTSVEGNTITRNHCKEGMGALYVQFGDLRVERNIICENAGAYGVQVQTMDNLVRLAGNDVWLNEAGAYTGIEPGENDIAADPLFCDPETGDFSLREGSPCLPDREGEERIGALGKGCPSAP